MPGWAAPAGAEEQVDAEPSDVPAGAPPWSAPFSVEDVSEPPIEEGPPLAGQLGAELQYTEEATKLARTQHSTHEGVPAPGEAGTSELRRHAVRHLSTPDRVAVNYHIVLTEERGNAGRTTRTLFIPATTITAPIQPIQILPVDEDRRRALIKVLFTSADGQYIAMGPRNLPTGFAFGNSTPATPGVPPPNAFLLAAADGVHEVKHTQDLFAVYLQDPNKGAAALSGAWVSIEVERGDPSLARVRPKGRPGG